MWILDELAQMSDSDEIAIINRGADLFSGIVEAV